MGAYTTIPLYRDPSASNRDTALSDFRATIATSLRQIISVTGIFADYRK